MKLPSGWDKMERDGAVVDLHDAIRSQRAGEHRQGVRRALGVALGLEAVNDVIDGHRRAVVELDSRPDLEGPYRCVGARAPACRQPRVVIVVLVSKDEPLADLTEHLQAALVGDRDRVDRRGRHADAGLDRRPGLALCCRARSAAGRAGTAAGRQDAAEQRHRQSDHGAPPQELPPGQPPRHELVNHMLRDRSMPGPQDIEPTVVNFHHTSHIAEAAFQIAETSFRW